ncbi:HotDog domain-containing protein [Hysterangium stoloniferum]|nr:HotDog domain-containing protein [Hysterangium stoloniferum]
MSITELKSRTCASYGFVTTHKTRWSDNDQYGHVNNSIYQHYFDTIINTYLIKYCGLNPLTSSTIGLAVATSCQYFRPLAFPQDIILGLRVNKLGRSSVVYEVAVFAAESPGDGPAAVGNFTHVFVDNKTRKPIPLGLELRSGLDRLYIGDGGLLNRGKL